MGCLYAKEKKRKLRRGESQKNNKKRECVMKCRKSEIAIEKEAERPRGKMG